MKKLKDKSAAAKLSKEMTQEDLENAYTLVELWGNEVMSSESRYPMGALEAKKCWVSGLARV